MFTKRHMDTAARIVSHILKGKWTDEPPAWAGVIPDGEVDAGYSRVRSVDDYTRAVQTAETFIVMFQQSSKFDVQRFLTACGLTDEAKVYQVTQRLK